MLGRQKYTQQNH